MDRETVLAQRLATQRLTGTPASDPVEAGYNSVYIWAAAVEAAGTLGVDASSAIPDLSRG